MKNSKMKRVLLVMLLQIVGVSIIKAQQSSEGASENKSEYAVEIDPATFFFNGYGVHLRFKPKKSNHLLLGLGAYAMDMPDFLVNMNSQNKDKGWQVRINQGMGLFGEYYFQQVNQKWFIGTQLGLQEYKIENEFEEGATATYTNLLMMGYGGYSWQPFDAGLYVKPWMGVGYSPMISGNNEVGTQKYGVAPFTSFMTLHVGYKF